MVVKTKFDATTLLQYLGYWHKRFKFLRRTCYAIFIVVVKTKFYATMLSRYQAYWRKQYSILKIFILYAIIHGRKNRRFDATTLSRYQDC